MPALNTEKEKLHLVSSCGRHPTLSLTLAHIHPCIHTLPSAYTAAGEDSLTSGFGGTNSPQAKASSTHTAVRTQSMLPDHLINLNRRPSLHPAPHTSPHLQFIPVSFIHLFLLTELVLAHKTDAAWIRSLEKGGSARSWQKWRGMVDRCQPCFGRFHLKGRRREVVITSLCRVLEDSAERDAVQDVLL